MRSDGHAAGGHEHVRGQPSLERAAMRVLVVGDGWEHLDLGARARERGSENRAVGLVDLTGGERLPWCLQLCARREDGGARAAGAHDLGDPGGGQCAELGGAQPNSRLDHRLTGAQISAARAHVRTQVHSCWKLHFVVIFDNILDGDDCVSSLGHDAARSNRHRLARRERPRRRPSGGDPGDHAKRSRNVPSTHCEAVHRRAWKRRQVNHRQSRRGEHAACCRRDRNGFRGQRLDSPEHERERFVDRKEFLHSAA